MRAGVCVSFLRCGHAIWDFFWKKYSFLAIFFRKKCAGTVARAGAKTDVRVRAPLTMKMCAMCVRVRTKIRAH